MKFIRLCSLSTGILLSLSASSWAGTLTPLATFGGGDGWRAPNEIVAGDTPGTATGSNYNYLSTGSLERGLTYNPTTGHLVLVSRSTAGNGIRLLDGTTGADVGALNQGSGVITGGTFTTNMVDAGSDGAIYVGNLSTAITTNFKVYRWGTETDAAPSVAYNALSGVTRTGDSFAAFGSGAASKIAAAGSNNVSASNFAVLSTVDGLNYTSTAYLNVPGTTTASNDYRLGLTFVDGDTLIGNQGTNGRITDFAATATVAATIPLGAGQRLVDFATIGGLPILAVADTNSSLVQLFDITNPAAPILVASGNATSGTLTANANGTGAVAFGNVVGSTATLYVMNTNQGIQAFSVTGVPEPASIMLLAIAATAGAGVWRRRG